MIEAQYTWRPLGAILVDRGLLSGDALQGALREQRRTGRLLGEILVEAGLISAFSLTRALSEQHYLAWSDAQELMAKVERENRRTIAARQSPFFIFLGVATIIGGCALAGRASFALYYMYANATELSGAAAIPDPRVLWFAAGQLITGIAM